MKSILTQLCQLGQQWHPRQVKLQHHRSSLQNSETGMISFVGIWPTVSCQEQLTLSSMPDYWHPGLKGLVIGWGQYQLHQSVWKMDNSSVRIAVGLRLGIHLVHSHQCCCGTTVTSDGHHGLSCKKSAGRQSRHSQINGIIHRAFLSADVLATREPTGLCTSAGVTGKRPDGITTVPWKKGRWDATCPDTFAISHIQASSISAGSAAKIAEEKKIAKYSDLPAGIDFVPIAIETSGAWGEKGFELVRELGRRITAANFDARSAIFLRQRISLAVQRGECFLDFGDFEE